eukprot:COSAG01_NODE_5590_length_4160_cov_1.695395_5_plen_132_part_00
MITQGVLLSGGLDSSLVASIAKRAVDARGGSGTNATGNVLHSFCIGLRGSPDIDAAQRVADFLGTKHHSFQFTIDEALDSISDAIYHMCARGYLPFVPWRCSACVFVAGRCTAAIGYSPAPGHPPAGKPTM